MWFELSEKERDIYKRLILAYASLSEAFAQKEDLSPDSSKSKVLRPIVNSKFQEACFQYAFNASAEDIGNTSFDVAVRKINSQDKTEKKYLIGIKTFSFNGSDQKVAQFKKEHDSWNALIQKMKTNVQGKNYSITEINEKNHELYLELAKKIAELRNQRIKSSIANLQGFKVDLQNDTIEYVYHVLMPSVEESKPFIHVGETDYTQIDIPNITIEGCTSAKLPSNFVFSDGKHVYKFTPADSQLYMNFDNRRIIQETWDVIYVKNAYSFFLELADKLYGPSEFKEDDSNKDKMSVPDISLLGSLPVSRITESYCWLIAPNGEVEKASGFNSFFGTGMKISLKDRAKRIKKIKDKYEAAVDSIKLDKFDDLINKLTFYSRNNINIDKFRLRDEICALLDSINDTELTSDVKALVFRPFNEMYIPIPDSREFHNNHPNFFGKNVGTFLESDPAKLALDKYNRAFILIFEPSGDAMQSYICQDNGKAIESSENQSNLGKWLRKGVFQLKDFEPLTVKKLNELEINGIRLYKTENKLYQDNEELHGEEIHIEFIWIDEDNIPQDFIGKIPK